MAKNLRWKLLIIVGVLALSVFAFYPPEEKVRLGLDLKGGVHLVMRVQTDDAVRLETETTADRLRELMKAQNLPGTVTFVSPTEFRVDGIPPEQDATFRQQLTDIELTYNRAPGAGTHTFTMRPNLANQLREEAVVQALQTIDRRVNELGVAEPIIARHSANDQILVQLPGVTDVARAKQIIRSTALLELKLVEQGPFSDEAQARQAYNNNLPPDLQILPGVSEGGQQGDRPTTVYYVLRRVPAVSGRDLRNSRPSLDENSRPAVGFSLNSEGARKFGNFTAANINRQLAVVLDNRVYSAPTINSRIDNEGIIQGSFTQQEAADLSLVLRSGALPASLTYLEERTVGPTLGRESIRSGVTAATGGLLFVMLFMLVYYKFSGINAVTAIVINLVILLGLMSYLGATMTLPGIAGFILTIGMGVDSNVLIFERIKEELQTAKGVRQAVAAGFDRVFLTILDTHVASLIAAAFLFQFGTGPIRGFATTLTIGLLSNVFTAVFVSRALFELVLSRRGVAKLSI